MRLGLGLGLNKQQSGGGITPENLSPDAFKAHYNAIDPANYTLGGTNGDRVISMADLTGNGNDAVASNNDRTPQIAPVQLNGRDILEADDTTEGTPFQLLFTPASFLQEPFMITTIQKQTGASGETSGIGNGARLESRSTTPPRLEWRNDDSGNFVVLEKNDGSEVASEQWLVISIVVKNGSLLRYVIQGEHVGEFDPADVAITDEQGFFGAAGGDFQIAEYMVHMDAPDTDQVKAFQQNRMQFWGLSSI